MDGSFSRILAALALCACGLGASLPLPIRAATLHARPVVPEPFITGTLVAAPTITILQPGQSTTLTVTVQGQQDMRPLLPLGGQVSVLVSAATAILHRDGKATLGELVAGDVLAIRGHFDPANAQLFDATTLRDRSLAEVEGSIAAVSSGTSPATITLTRSHGQPLTIPVDPSTPVVYGPTDAAPTTFAAVAGSTVGLHAYVVVALAPGTGIVATGARRIRLPSELTVTGTLTTLPSSTHAPVALTIQTASGPLGFTVATSTKIVRKYGGISGLDELSTGDSLTVEYSLASGQPVATLVRDTSIQAAYTTLTGTVQGVAQDGANAALIDLTVLVTKDTLGRSPFPEGQTLVLPVLASGSPACISPTPDILPCPRVTIGKAVTQGLPGLSSLVQGESLSALGVYDSVAKRFTSVFRLYVRSTALHIAGTLAAVPAPGTAPTTLSITVTSGSLPSGFSSPVQVGVGSSTRIVRKDNSTVGLAELAQGDSLEVDGTVSGGTLLAGRIQDNSLQGSYTTLTGVVGAVTPGNVPGSYTLQVTLTRDPSTRSPFPAPVAGQPQVFTLPITISTKVIIGKVTTSGLPGPAAIAVGQTVTARGVYNSNTRQFDSISSLQVAPSATHLSGTLAATPPATTPPGGPYPALTLTLADNTTVQVQTTAQTRFVRPSDRRSGIDELSQGDSIRVIGQQGAPGTFVASAIQDDSIRYPYTTLVGTVQSVPAAGTAAPYTITVVAQQDGSARTSIPVGRVVPVAIGTTTQIVVNAGGTPGTIATGATVTVLGSYDRATKSFAGTFRIRVH